MTNFDLKKFLVENKLTANSKALSLNEANRDKPVMIDGKEVDEKTIEVDNVYADDFPDFSDAYASKAEFTDGTELTDKQLSILDAEYSYLINQAAVDSFTGN